MPGQIDGGDASAEEESTQSIKTDDALANLRAEVAKLQQLSSEVDVLRTSIQGNASQSTTLLAEIQSHHRDSSAVATQALAAKTQINDAQAVIATKSDHIQKAQEHADKVRGDLDRLLTAAQAQITDIEGNKVRAKTSADTALELQTSVASSKATSDADIGFVKQALAAALADAIKIQNLAEKAKTIEERVAIYEARLTDFDARATKQLETIVALLPGATSAGLASAFDNRRKTFLEPGKRWQWIFVGSLVMLVVIAATGMVQVYFSSVPLDYNALFRHWLLRLPIAVSLIWLALHASREASLAKRLEEDYGYKSAIASSFQGFQHQMKEMGASTAPNSPLAKLCEDTLATLASPPGRIYEKHALTVSPSTEMAVIAKAAVEAALDAKK
jgi:hypothetical protein